MLQLGRAALQLGARAAAGGAAPVEQRQGQVDLPAACHIAVAGGPVRGGVAAVAQADVAEDGAGARPAPALAQMVQVAAQGAQVQALAQRGGLGIVPGAQLRGGLRDGGQLVGQLEIDAPSPQAHQAGQLLMLGRGGQARTRQLGCGVLLDTELARLLQPAEVAHAGHAPRQLGTGLGRLVHALAGRQLLACGHGAQPSAARVGGQPQHVLRGGQGGLFHLHALPAAAPGQGDQADQAEAQLALDLALVAVDHAAQGQRGVGQCQGLHAVCILHAQLCQARLQAGVVEQCDAHGLVHVQRLAQPLVDALLRRVAGLQIGWRQFGAVRQAAGGMGLDRAAQAVGRDAGAAGQGQHGSHGADQPGGGEDGALHGRPPCCM